jgi:hypothetical protein
MGGFAPASAKGKCRNKIGLLVRHWLEASIWARLTKQGKIISGAASQNSWFTVEVLKQAVAA